jgi:hypothetical protein
VTTVHEVPIRIAEIQVDHDDKQVSPRVPALETERFCATSMQCGVLSVEEFSGRAASEFLREGRMRPGPLLGHSGYRHRGKRGVRRESKEFSRAQDRVAMEERAPKCRTEGVTGRGVGSGGVMI